MVVMNIKTSRVPESVLGVWAALGDWQPRDGLKAEQEATQPYSFKSASLIGLRAQLEASGWTLVSVRFHEDTVQSKLKISFFFKKSGEAANPAILSAFDSLCQLFGWNMQVYINPNGTSINLASAESLFDNDDVKTPRMVWPKDSDRTDANDKISFTPALTVGVADANLEIQ